METYPPSGIREHGTHTCVEQVLYLFSILTAISPFPFLQTTPSLSPSPFLHLFLPQIYIITIQIDLYFYIKSIYLSILPCIDQSLNDPEWMEGRCGSHMDHLLTHTSFKTPQFTKEKKSCTDVVRNSNLKAYSMFTTLLLHVIISQRLGREQNNPDMIYYTSDT